MRLVRGIGIIIVLVAGILDLILMSLRASRFSMITGCCGSSEGG
jgi:hypothetical protein